MTRSRTAAALAAAITVLAGAAATGSAAPAAAAPATNTTPLHDDFNGDGYHDLVVAAPSATVKGDREAGFLAVLYGSADGVGTGNRKVVNQSTPGVSGTPEPGDGFGSTLTSADFDGDGYADLAVGITGEDVGGVADTGYVTVLFGSARGITGDSAGLRPSSLVEGIAHGTGLASGDFFHDGSNALAILDRNHVELYGFASGPGSAPTVSPAMSPATSPATSSAVPEFPQGFTPTGLVPGDFEGDGNDDLVVTGSQWQFENLEGHSLYLRGGAEGGFTTREFAGGPAGTAGDIDGDGADDLVIGDPTVLEHGEWDLSGGVVEIWYGGGGEADGPGAAEPERWRQGTGGVPGAYELEDRFGSDVSLRDVDADGHPDLAVGAEGEAIGTRAEAGAVWLLRGGPDGLTSGEVRTFNQDTPGVPGRSEAGDLFGSDVRLIDADGDGHAGLLAGAPGENYGNGYAWVLRANANGLTARGSWTFNGESLGADAASPANAGFPETISE